jgi:hypothetical protein
VRRPDIGGDFGKIKAGHQTRESSTIIGGDRGKFAFGEGLVNRKTATPRGRDHHSRLRVVVAGDAAALFENGWADFLD